MTDEKLNSAKRAILICELVNRLRTVGNWPSESVLQKAVYLLQDLFGVPMGYIFFLYLHAPYSTSLCDELACLRANGVLEFLFKRDRAPGYCVCAGHLPVLGRALRKYDKALQRVAETVRGKNVGELELLTTALYVTKERRDEHTGSSGSRVVYVISRYPHIRFRDAMRAMDEADRLLEEQPPVPPEDD